MPTRHESSLQQIRLDHLAIIFLVIGSVLRVIWPADMEWKADEVWMFENSRAVVAGAPWPLLGMPTSIGPRNPGMSIWPFILIAYLSGNPVVMAMVVQLVNVLALWGLYVFIRWKIPLQQREPWLWGLILVSVSSLPILFSRKIWSPDLLPAFSLLVLIGHWCRQHRWGSFLWGLVGALIGQVHMSGFFLAFAIWAWTLVRARRSVRWFWWLLGSLIGAIGLWPWLREFFTSHISAWNIKEVITFKFFTQWIAIALGVDLQFSMHSAFWLKFLKEPVVAGIPTYLIAVAHGFLLLVFLSIVWRWFRKDTRLADRHDLETFPEIRFYLQATLIGVGVLMTLEGTRVYAHYLVVLFPFIHLWLAMKLYRHRRTLLGVALAQLFISVVFLVYVHQHGGVPEGDYGVAFRKQVYPSATR